MRKPWSISFAFAVALYAFAPASLFAQAGTSQPNDPAAATNSQTAQPGLAAPDQPQPSNPYQGAAVAPQNQDSGEQAAGPQTGIIVGTVTDMNESPISGATVTLQGPEAGDVHVVKTSESGFFEIRDVQPGRAYQVSIQATGFSEWDSPEVTLEPGQSRILDVSKLRIEEVQTSVTVTPESDEQIAIEQVKTEEQQRGFAIIPNFYAVYDSNPAPLTAKLRFSLALRVARDPFTLAGVAMLAGIGQAADSPEYIQGARGYAERYGENYANSLTDVFLNGAILPSLLHQDPRYYYKGTGSAESRAVHALSSLVITKGDNGRSQPNYSGFGGDLASAAIANLYYPREDRGVGLVFRGFAVDTAVHAAVRMLDEFVFRPSRAHPPDSALNNGRA